jgi:hypothetical protein
MRNGAGVSCKRLRILRLNGSISLDYLDRVSMLRRILSIFAVSTAVCAVGWCQETRGTIVGRITDPTGAVVANASVEVLNQAMGITTSLKTGPDGIYTAPLLLPGSYRVTVTAPGFKQFVRNNIQLQVADRIQVNAALEVGTSQQSITVTGTPEILSTQTASTGNVITEQQIRDLPLSYGDPFSLIGVSSGTAFTGSVRLDRPFEPTHIANYTINGARGDRSDITLDGAPATATANPGGVVIATYVPPTDVLGEFKVQTAVFDAATGFTEGGVTNLSIKSGSNAFHGTAYYGVTRKDFWANDFFNNSLGNQRPNFRFDRWGGTIGGPVWIPKIYKGTNKTFFFVGEEGLHDARPRYDSTTPTTPTPAMKTGDFSSLLTNGGRSYQIYNPYSRVLNSNGSIGVSPFAGNRIPANLINPVGQKILSYWGDPTSPGNNVGVNNLLEPDLAEKAKYYNVTARIDQNIGEKQRIYGRYSTYRRDSTYNNYFGDNDPAAGVFFQFFSKNAVFDDTLILSPTLVLDLRYGYNRFIRYQDGNPAGNGFDLTALGLPASFNDSIPTATRRFPRIDLSGYISNGQTGENRPADDHALAASLTKTVGAHSMHSGFEFRSYRQTDSFFSNDQSGRFVFDGTLTAGPTTAVTVPNGGIGLSVAQLLLGLPTAASYAAIPASYAEQSTVWGLYFQDDWKVTPKLTLNLGLRWEFETPLTERYNRSVTTFDPNYVQPINAAAQAVYNALGSSAGRIDPFIVHGGLLFASASGNGQALYSTPKLNLMPRFGLAYLLPKSTVMRAGFGQFDGFLGQRRGDVFQPGYSQQTFFNPFAANNLTVANTLTNPFPNGLLQPVGSGNGPQTLLGQGTVAFFNQNPRIPEMYRWQFDIQHQFSNSLLLDVGYVGNKAINVEITRNINAIPDQYLGALNTRDNALNTYMTALVTNPFKGLLPAGASSTYTGNTIQRQYLLVPFPGFGTINTTTNEGSAWYHSFQVRLEKRFSGGLSLVGNYTFSKFMQATDLLNASDPAPTRMISDVDIPHRIAMDAIYQLPFGHGHRWLASSNGIINRIVGGWEISGVWAAQTGTPLNFAPTTVNDYFLAGPADAITAGNDHGDLAHYFNQSAFVTASTGQPAFHLRNNPFRFANVRGWGIDNVDLAVIKDTRIREGQVLRFNVQALNAFNHPLLPNPTLGITSANFGIVSGSTQSNYPRRLQLELKYIF